MRQSKRDDHEVSQWPEDDRTRRICYRTAVVKITSGLGDVPTKKLVAEMEVLQVANEMEGRRSSVHGLKRWSKKGGSGRESRRGEGCLIEVTSLPVWLFEGVKSPRGELRKQKETQTIASGRRCVDNDVLR